MDIMQAIRDRRSVRKFTADPVGDDLIDAILEAGRWAPSWANTQCSRFVVVTDDALKAQLSETLDNINPAKSAVKNAPVTIVVCGELEKSGYYNGAVTTDKGDWFMFDTALATQNMALVAHSLGLGTVIVGLFDSPKVSRILKLPPKVAPVVMVPLGCPARSYIAPRRLELAEIVYRNTYGGI